MKIYVYCLIDPRDNLPFYVGCGAKERPYASGQYSYHENTRKNDRIKELSVFGQVPVIEVLKVSDSKQMGFDWESFYIRKFGRLDLNRGSLLNETDGRAGLLNPAVRIRLKMSSSRLGKSKSVEHRKAISNSLKGKSKSKEHILKNSMSHLGLIPTEENRRKRSETMKRLLQESPRRKNSKGQFV